MTAAPEGRFDVVSAGILVADCVARPVIRRAQPGRLELVEHIGLHPGGSAGNTAYGLARMGHAVAVAGRVGADGFGDFLVRECGRHGCDDSLIRVDEGAATSATLVTVDPEGERAFLHSVGANARFVPGDLPLDHLAERGARVLHLAGYFVLPGMEGTAGEPAAALFAAARERGLVTSLDCVWDATGRWLALARAVLPETDFFCPSLPEAQAMTGEQNAAAAARALLDLGVRQAVALKMGPEGSLTATPDGATRHVPAARVPVLDGTGAGDAFIAGFLAAWLRGLPVADCARHGNAAGATCVTALGATDGVGDWPAVSRLAATLG